ncbi:MAG: hypothetical protein MOGMAGMI_01059 [Candidatus Omnitrophica bacterium]|nr:hypothetical protein [Candidatus Omnitrophota bacterium]
MKTLYVLQHVENEPAGLWSAALVSTGRSHTVVRLYAGEPLPAPENVGALLVLGGPMNVDEDARYPFLGVEKQLIARCVRDGKPYFGICLGAQLLARSLGARVYKAPCEEIGWDTVDRTSAPDEVFGPELGPKLSVFQWHGDTFDLPEGAVLIHRGERVEHQAFRWGSRAYGVQYHTEIDESMLRQWFPEGPELEEYVRYWRARHERLGAQTLRIFSAWMSLAYR